MSRSGYTDECDDPLLLGRWRAQIASATRGKRGQKFFRDLIAALDAMPEKRLIAGALQDDDGCVCALGALGKASGIDLSKLDTEDYDALGEAFDIAHQLAQETMYENDEWVEEYKYLYVEIIGPMRTGFPHYESHRRSVRVPIENAAEKRWRHVRSWAEKQIARSDTSTESK